MPPPPRPQILKPPSAEPRPATPTAPSWPKRTPPSELLPATARHNKAISRGSGGSQAFATAPPSCPVRRAWGSREDEDEDAATGLRLRAGRACPEHQAPPLLSGRLKDHPTQISSRGFLAVRNPQHSCPARPFRP